MQGVFPPRLYPIFATKIIVILIGVFFYKRLSFPYKLFLLHIIIALTAEAYGAYLNYIKQPSNTWLFNIYFIVELWIIGWAGQLLLQREKVRKYIVLMLGAFTVYWGVNFWFKHSEGKLLNIFSITSSLFLVALYVWVLFSGISFTKQRIFSNPLFYICISCLLYFACLIPLMGFINYIYKTNQKAAYNLYYITHTLSYIRYILVGVVFYLCGMHAKKAA